MKRIIASLLLVVVLLTGVIGSLSSCEWIPGNKKPAADFVMPEGGYDGSEITIKFYHTMGAALTSILTDAIASFNELYPNITVEHQSYGNYDALLSQINTEITVGNQPSLAYCYPDHVATYNVAGAVQALDELVNSTIVEERADGTTETIGYSAEQRADFIEAYWNEGLSYGDGKMYSIALAKSTEVLYYNKTFFEEHNLTVPTTWDEMEAVCRQIKEIEPGCIPLGYDSEANWFITMCEQYGSPYTSATGDHFLFDNDTNKAFIKRFREWYQKGYVTTQEIYGSYTSGLFTTLGESYTDDDGNYVKVIKSYMSIGSSAGATHQRPAKADDGTYPFEVGITSIPQINAEDPKVISQGPSVCIFKKDNPQEVIASWLFVKFLTTSVDFQAEFSMASGYVPVIKSVTNNEIYADFLSKANGGSNIAALSAQVCLDQEKAYYTSPAFNGSSTAREQVGALLQKCLLIGSKEDVDAKINEAFKDAIDECIYQS